MNMVDGEAGGIRIGIYREDINVYIILITFCTRDRCSAARESSTLRFDAFSF